jgi:hypothetical protein
VPAILYGSRPLIITALDYGLFLAYVLGLDDERWHVQCRIDDRLAWAAGWGLEMARRALAGNGGSIPTRPTSSWLS